MHDLVIRNGTVVDGTGAPASSATSPSTAAHHRGAARLGAARRGRTEIDADGRARDARLRRHPHPLRRPGHLGPDARAVELARRDHRRDGQLRRRLRAGRARPARVAHRADGGRGGHPRHGPAPRASAGSGRRFPEYLDALDAHAAGASTSAPRSPHGAVRAYVMGERGRPQRAGHARRHRAPWPRIVREAIEAGALGVLDVAHHRSPAIDGEPVPGTFAAEDELFGIGPRARRRSGAGVFELAPAGAPGEDLAAPEREVDWMRRLAERDRPAGDVRPAPARRRPRRVAAAARPRRRGATSDGRRRVRPQVAGRPSALLLGLQTFHPLFATARVPRARAAAARRAGRRAARPRRAGAHPRRDARRRPDAWRSSASASTASFALGDPPDYEPDAVESDRRAWPQRRGVDPWRPALRPDARRRRPRAADCAVLNYSDGNLDADPRDAAAPGDRARARRRRRPLRRDLRRVDRRRSCSRTGRATAPRRAPAARAAWSSKHDRRHRRALRPAATAACSRRACRADLNVIDFDAAAAAPARDGPRPAGRRRARSSSGPTATSPRS